MSGAEPDPVFVCTTVALLSEVWVAERQSVEEGCAEAVGEGSGLLEALLFAETEGDGEAEPYAVAVPTLAEAVVVTVALSDGISVAETEAFGEIDGVRLAGPEAEMTAVDVGGAMLSDDVTDSVTEMDELSVALEVTVGEAAPEEEAV